MAGSRTMPPSWLTAAAKRVGFEGNIDNQCVPTDEDTQMSQPHQLKSLSDVKLSLSERALSAAGAAVISAIIVNPLDVAKTRLQAQAAGIPYQNQCNPACFETDAMLPDLRSGRSHNGVILGGGSTCSRECSPYKGTFDVFYKVIRQEGFSRLWRGTNASLALAVPTVGIYLPCYDMLRNYLEEFTEQHASNLTPYSPLVAGSAARTLACITCYPVELARTRMQAFTETQGGAKPAGVWKTLLGVVSPLRTANQFRSLQNYRILWTGLGAQLARDVPFSAICWGTLEPVSFSLLSWTYLVHSYHAFKLVGTSFLLSSQIRRKILSLTGDEVNAGSILGANFSAGFVAGTLAAAATCPLDVARTRRQIEKDPARQMRMTTRQTLLEIRRDGGWKGLFTGVAPRVARAGPSVGIVVSSYEVVKYALYHRHLAD